MLRLLLLVGAIAFVPLSATAAGDADGDRLQAFGLLGAWAVDCRQPASRANPQIEFSLGQQGRPTYQLRTDDPNFGLVTELSKVAIVADDRIAFSFSVKGHSYDVLLLKTNGHIRSIESRADDGRLAIDHGIVASTGRETPSFEKCKSTAPTPSG